MAGVKVFGHTFSKGEAVAIGGGGIVVIYFVWKQHKAADAAAAASSGSGIDPLTGLPTSEDNQVDPDTGMTYLAEAQQYGSVQAAEQAVAGESSLDLSSAGDTSTGAIGSSYATPLVPSNDVQSATYASNAAWDQAATAGLVDLGYSSTDVGAALGRYLGNLSLTSTQATIVQTAIGEYGPPPVGTFQIIMAPATTSTSSGNTGTGQSTDDSTPVNTTSGAGGWSSGGSTSGGSSSSSSSGGASGGSSGGATSSPVQAPATTQNSTVHGGEAIDVTNNTAVVLWDYSGPATSWHLTITGPGAINGHQATVTIPQGTYSGLEAGHNYEVNVQPLPTGTPGTITFKTTGS